MHAQQTWLADWSIHRSGPTATHRYTYSYDLYSYGLCSYGLYSYGYIVMAIHPSGPTATHRYTSRAACTVRSAHGRNVGRVGMVVHRVMRRTVLPPTVQRFSKSIDVEFHRICGEHHANRTKGACYKSFHQSVSF